ncbi:MAG: GvpL/GvpF family gas vesicle protein [Rhodoferax sp.]
MSDGLPAANMPAMGVYLYCLAPSECLAVLAGLTESGGGGVDGCHPVGALEDAGLVAVVADVLIGEFSEDNLQTLSWVGARAARHEAVVERIMGASPVLPVKFGTIFRSRASLQEFLGRHREVIVAALEHLRDKAEWSVKGYLLEEDARRGVAAADPEICSRRAALPSSPGARYLQERQLDALIASRLEAGLAQVGHDLHRGLAPHAEDCALLRCHPSKVTGRAQRMVFNGSFLLGAEALAGFRTAVAEQQNAYQGIGLSLELHGPWPPYSFCPQLSDGSDP